MLVSSLPRAAAAAVACTLALAACGSSGSDTASSPGNASSSAAPTGSVGVILPDATTSPRWESNDRPLLEAAVRAIAGLQLSPLEQRASWAELAA